MIRLRDVTPENFEAVVKLTVADEQREFVASNMYSLAEAKVYPECVPQAVYAEDELVGFAMYTIYRGEAWILRLMISPHAQGKGYGRAAMQEMIARHQAMPGVHRLFISYEPHNRVAKGLYASMGFRPTGEILEGEEVAVLEW